MLVYFALSTGTDPVIKIVFYFQRGTGRKGHEVWTSSHLDNVTYNRQNPIKFKRLSGSTVRGSST